MAPKRAPRDLGEAGKALWRAVHASYELTPAEEALVVEAARTADELARLAGMVGKTPPITNSAHGIIRANPIWAEIRAHRVTLDRLLRSLALPDTAAGDVEPPVRLRKLGVPGGELVGRRG